MNVVDARELTRVFGQRVAVDKLSLQVEVGAALGLIGPAGAGKTTTLKMLATLLAPTSGDALIAGASIKRDVAHVRRLVGYMPDAFGTYPDMTVAEYMDFFASCYHIPSRERAALANDLLQLVDLAHHKTQPVDRLTTGAKQRLSLARTLAHDPQVLLLDQPTAGLDPRARVEFRELIRELLSMNKTVVMTSRILAELEDLCTHVAVMDRGRVMIAGPFEAIAARLRPHRIIAVKFFGDAAPAINCARTGAGVIDVQLAALESSAELTGGRSNPAATPVLLSMVKEMRIAFAGDYNDASELLRHLLRAGVQVVAFGELSDALEELLVTLQER